MFALTCLCASRLLSYHSYDSKLGSELTLLRTNSSRSSSKIYSSSRTSVIIRGDCLQGTVVPSLLLLPVARTVPDLDISLAGAVLVNPKLVEVLVRDCDATIMNTHPATAGWLEGVR